MPIAQRLKIGKAKSGRSGAAGVANSAYKNGSHVTVEKPCAVCAIPFTAKVRQETCSTACAAGARGIKLRRFYRETEAGLALATRYAAELRSVGNPAWEHPEYAAGFTSALKRRIRRRDGDQCRKCGAPNIAPRMLAIHHIDGGKINHDPSNLITLCKSCHMAVHRNGVDASIYLP